MLLGKMYKYEMDPTRTVGTTEQTWCGTNMGRTDGVKPIYSPTTLLYDIRNPALGILWSWGAQDAQRRVAIIAKSAAHWCGRGAYGPALRDPHAGNRSHWCRSWCWIPRRFLWLVHRFSEFDVDKMIKGLLTWPSQDKASTSIPMQAPLLLCIRNFKMFHINVFPSIGLSYWKIKFLTPKTSWTSQRKAFGCGKLPHVTRWVFLRMQSRKSARACVNSPYLFMCVWTFGASPQCGT